MPICVYKHTHTHTHTESGRKQRSTKISSDQRGRNGTYGSCGVFDCDTGGGGSQGSAHTVVVFEADLSFS